MKHNCDKQICWTLKKIWLYVRNTDCISEWWKYLNQNLLHDRNEELTVPVSYTRGLSIKWSNKVSRLLIGIRIFFSRHLTEPKIAVENVYRRAITGVIVLSAVITKVKSGLLSVTVELKHNRHELGVSGQNDAHQNYTLVIGLKDWTRGGAGTHCTISYHVRLGVLTRRTCSPTSPPSPWLHLKRFILKGSLLVEKGII